MEVGLLAVIWVTEGLLPLWWLPWERKLVTGTTSF